MPEKTVLIVDDESMVRLIVRRTLQSGRRSTLEAADGLSALSAARASRPDLIVLDARMPGELDGYDVARALKADDRTRAIPHPDAQRHEHGPRSRPRPGAGRRRLPRQAV